MLTVILADTDPLAAGRLRGALEGHGAAVVGEAGSRKEAVRQVVAQRPDVLVTSVRLEDGEAFPAVRTVTRRSPRTAIVMLTIDPSESEMLSAIGSGAIGYLPVGTGDEALARAIVGAADGDLAVPRRLAGALVRRLAATAFGGRLGTTTGHEHRASRSAGVAP